MLRTAYELGITKQFLPEFDLLMKTEQEIKTTEAELKELRLKAKELRKKIEDKQKDEIFSALLASGKTVEEVMTYLKSGNEEKVE